MRVRVPGLNCPRVGVRHHRTAPSSPWTTDDTRSTRSPRFTLRSPVLRHFINAALHPSVAVSGRESCRFLYSCDITQFLMKLKDTERTTDGGKRHPPGLLILKIEEPTTMPNAYAYVRCGQGPSSPQWTGGDLQLDLRCHSPHEQRPPSRPRPPPPFSTWAATSARPPPPFTSGQRPPARPPPPFTTWAATSSSTSAATHPLRLRCDVTTTTQASATSGKE